MTATRTFGIALIAVLAVFGCTAKPAPPPATGVAITDFRMVAGRWQGLVTGIPGPRGDESDAVRVTIGEDGSYDFGVYRTIGAFEGKGHFAIRDGKLVTVDRPRPTTFSLYERDGRRWLEGDAVLSNGVPVRVELQPVR